MKTNISEVIDRLKAITRINKDCDLARELGVAKTTVSSWRKRGSIPYDELIELSEKYNVSMDWLLFGDPGADEIDPALKYRCLQLEKILHGEFDHLKDDLGYHLDKLEQNYILAKKIRKRLKCLKKRQ